MRAIGIILSLAIFMIGFATCQSTGGATEGKAVTVESDTQEEAVIGTSFGADFSPASVVAFSDLNPQVPASDSVAVMVQGKVDAVCQAKGCWMTMMSPAGEEMMVKFKDYGFFMPKDIAGREVIVNGKAYYETTSIDELRHYAEDAGKSEEEIQAITEPKQELKFYADGVILLDEK
ncbi:MAG: DUF4920 domain-containing protein [Bacteroidota bacterium]